MDSLQTMNTSGLDTTDMEHLGLYGTEGTAAEGDGTLRNPVYWNEGHAILVWIALLEDNKGVYDAKSNLVSPDLLNPAFDTTYIQCNALPVVPRDHEAAYFQAGGFAEGDMLEASISGNQQMSASATGTPILIGGFGKKVQFVFNHPRTPVNKDLCPAGA